MVRIQSAEVYEAEELLEEICSLFEEAIEALPTFYQEAARRYRRLANCGVE
jgi:hypothetical protein